ncbi:MAG TPA: arsenate reductase (glutaredoxin) [Rhizobiales bacterium]|nr:arsenate reductase (glutaredoxin) [Hyphomicrobiales bacterium]
MTKILHNPRCSKSRAALELIKSKGLEPLVIEYLKDAPSSTELHDILTMLGKGPRDIIRRGEAVYKELGLDDPDLSDDVLIEAMVDNPILIERPIVIKDGKAAIGRPIEDVEAIL